MTTWCIEHVCHTLNKGVFSDQQKSIHVQIQQKCDFDFDYRWQNLQHQGIHLLTYLNDIFVK